MGLRAVRFLSLLFTAVALGAALAHLLALPNKIHLPREDYLVVQQIYQSWALLGIADIRQQWEDSHAAGACLYLVAFASLVLSVLVKCETRPARSDDHRPSAASISG
jgi:hypothetical protein